MEVLTNIAAAESSSNNLFEALGIDWQMFLFQLVGFVILVVVLGKFVYPILMRSVDKRQADIEAGAKAAHQAEEKAAKAEADVDKLMQKARREASEIVTTAREEATAALEDAEAKAKTRADAIVATAHDQIQKDVLAAKKQLQNETVDLVALATEKVVGKTVSKRVDSDLIASSVKEVK